MKKRVGRRSCCNQFVQFVKFDCCLVSRIHTSQIKEKFNRAPKIIVSGFEKQNKNS